MLRPFAPLLLTLSLALAVFVPQVSLASTPTNAIAWQPWSPTAFTQAKAEKRYVFLYLEAVWCHWCHVMQNETFSQPAVQQALKRNYIAIKVDHDANPLLATRYRDFGWPALIFFAPDGTEIVKRAGYIGPEDFQRLLAAIVKDPSPEETNVARTSPIAGRHELNAEQRQRLLKFHERDYDNKLGGLNTAQKFIDRDSVEYAIVHANNPAETRKAQQTLDAARALIDPVWGGAYQYSTGGDWAHPHYEKIMRVQAGYLRIYSQAYALWQRKEDLQSARAIRDYLKNFLRSPEGAFYVSQDADLVQGQKSHSYFKLDDAGRRQLGMPRIDKQIYADANGLAIEALLKYYEATGDAETLNLALTAAQWISKHRSMNGGGYRHGSAKSKTPYLSDNLAMGRAYLALYRATGERQWLARSVSTANFITRSFRAKTAGFIPGLAQQVPIVPLPDLADNISVARYFNLLSHYQGDSRFKAQALHAMKYLSVAERQLDFEEAGILLADEELASEPAHFTIVAPFNDPTARALYAVALRAPGSYKRVEWWDPAHGPLANASITYPRLPKPAAFICAAGRCSVPSFAPEDYAKRIAATTGG